MACIISGIPSIRLRASSDHFGFTVAPDSIEDSMEENGQLPPEASSAAGLACAAADPMEAAAESFRVPRVSSNGSGAVARPPSLTPRALTSWVSPALVTIEKRLAQLGHSNMTPRDSSPGFSTF